MVLLSIAPTPGSLAVTGTTDSAGVAVACASAPVAAAAIATSAHADESRHAGD